VKGDEEEGVGVPEAARPEAEVYGRLRLPEPPEGRPFVYINMAMTLDGKVTVGRPGYLLSGSSGDRAAMEELRAQADAVMVGAGTVRHEDPSLRISRPAHQAWRAEAGMLPDPLYCVVSASANLPAELRLFRSPNAVVVTREDAPEDRVLGLRSRCRVLQAGVGEVDLRGALSRLRLEDGVRRLLVEGGPTLSFNLIRLGLVDELFLTLSPLLKGGRDVPSLLGGPGFSYEELRHAKLLSLLRHSSELYLRYRLLPPGG
jgi:2,5-diamino-6-(ribosylamino)-4(3H)-pyrimidinone 5'-phosphate reductase